MTHPSDETRPDDTSSAPGRADEADQAVDEAVEESFPASDPPSWSPAHSGSPDPKPASPAEESR